VSPKPIPDHFVVGERQGSAFVPIVSCATEKFTIQGSIGGFFQGFDQANLKGKSTPSLSTGFSSTT